MVQHSLLLFLFFFSLDYSHGQDERYFRQMISGELPKFAEQKIENPIQELLVRGPAYQIDLNGDGIEESITPLKRDGADLLEFKDSSLRVFFEAKLFANGGESTIYKLKLVQLSKTLRALIIYLDEGVTRGRRFESTARIFVASFENNDLSKISLIEGPHFYHEREAQRDQYWRRDYVVNVYDMDGDGTREIAVQYNHIQRILKYKSFGEWERL